MRQGWFWVAMLLSGAPTVQAAEMSFPKFTEGNGRQNCQIFDIQEDKVTWLKREASTKAQRDCVVETLKDVDPEYFYRLNERAAVYKGHVYLVTANEREGDAQLSILTPEELPAKLEQNFSMGGVYYNNYSLGRDGQLFREQGEPQRYDPTSGQWITIAKVPADAIHLLPPDNK